MICVRSVLELGAARLLPPYEAVTVWGPAVSEDVV